MVMQKLPRLTHDAGDFNRLPLDLWFQILSFLPVKSLLVLSAACKSLLSIIQDPLFAAFHLRHFPANLSETQFLTVTSDDGTAFQVRSGPTTTNHFTEPRLHTGKDPGWWELANSLDGLVLLVSTKFIDSTGRRAVLWNPSARCLRQLTLPEQYTRHLGLGYDPAAGDYKVLAMTGYGYTNRVWFHALKTRAWAEILDTGFGRRFGNKSVFSQSLACNGGVAWIESCASRKVDGNGLTWFGFETGKFKYTKVPYSMDPKGRSTGSRLVTLDGGSSVGVWGVDAESQGYIWALETESMMWAIRHKIDRKWLPKWTGNERVRFVERNGELVWKYWTKDSHSVKVLSYDIATQAIKRLKGFEGKVEDCFGVYIESLVML